MNKFDESMVVAAIEAANQQKRPLFLLFLATRPCFIKMASLISAFRVNNVPHLVLDTGQHYDPALKRPIQEFSYHDQIAIKLDITGDLTSRVAKAASAIATLHKALKDRGLRPPAVPVVSGDTSAVGSIPMLWYLASGERAVHVEAGLRSFAPELCWQEVAGDNIGYQRQYEWKRRVDEPFPEGLNTRLASQASQVLLCPVSRNVENLTTEGYSSSEICLVGSLSADAVHISSQRVAREPSFFTTDLAGRDWIRVDLHRRENMSASRLSAVVGGIERIVKHGINVLVVNTNAFASATRHFDLTDRLTSLSNRTKHFVLSQPWPEHADIVQFMTSGRCLAILTDSGGLQEESACLGAKCITVRFSTDRPETILDARCNVLVPPISGEFFASSTLAAVFREEILEVNEFSRGLYGSGVGSRIVRIVVNRTEWGTAAGAEFTF